MTKSLVKPKKKLTPASICSQKAWSKLAKPVKKELRKSLPDSDKDGVPNKYDCHPQNKRRQESFLPADEAYLNSEKPVELGKYIASGKTGDVYELKGRRHLVIKVPTNFGDMNGCSIYEGMRRTLINSEDLLDTEADKCTKYNTDRYPLFSPTKIVKLRTNTGLSCLDNREYTGLIRPKVAPVLDYAKDVRSRDLRRLTDAQVEVIRQKVIALSYQGFIIGDALQIGLDYANRPLLYDIGYLRRTNKASEFPEVFANNNGEWKHFLMKIGRLKNTRSSFERDLPKYGQIVFEGFHDDN